MPRRSHAEDSHDRLPHGDIPLTDAERDLLDERLAMLERNPDDTIPGEVVLAWLQRARSPRVK